MSSPGEYGYVPLGCEALIDGYSRGICRGCESQGDRKCEEGDNEEAEHLR